jgi:hypothetical protein
MKTASNVRQLKNINVGYLSNHLLDHTQILNLSLQIFQMKMTSNERQPQNIKSRISQQPLFGPCLNFELTLNEQTISYKSLK